MQADAAADSRQNGDTPRSLRNLHLISAAIFAYTGQPPARSALPLLLHGSRGDPMILKRRWRCPAVIGSGWATIISRSALGEPLANEAWRGVRGSGSEAEGRPLAARYLRRLNVAPPAPTVRPCRRQERRTTIPRTTTSDRPPPAGFWSTITCGRRSAAARAAFASGRLTPRPGTRSATADGDPSWARTTG
jgi:hypothetical protein